MSIALVEKEEEVTRPVIQVTLQELVDGAQALGKFVSLYQIGEGVSPSQAFKLSRLAKRVQDELKTHNEQQMILAAKYGEEKEGNYTFPEWEKRKAFQDGMKELGQTPISIPGERIALGSLKSIAVSAGDLMLLEWLIQAE